jgi:FkbH-like protein
MQFRQITSNLKKDFSGFKKIKVAILADSSTQYLAQALRGIGYEKKLDIEVWEADYDSIDLTINDASTALYSFSPDFTILFLSLNKLRNEFYKSGNNEDFANEALNYLKGIVSKVSSTIKTKFIAFNFPEMPDSVFGNYANKVTSSFTYQLKKLNLGLMDWMQNEPSVTMVDLSGLSAMHGHANTFDSRLYISTSTVFGLDFIITIANNCIQVIEADMGILKKCLILDLDNTLWGGIIGDDGIENIQIGDLGIGKVFTELQLWAKALKERGIILVVCSKNDEANAKEPFIKHPDMVLRLDDIVVFVANWENKPDNIRYIQSVLNIGFDSMVFLDDNPFERNMVRQFLPEVHVPELPEDPADFLPFMLAENLFETNSYTEEDKERTRLYKEETHRSNTRVEYTSEEDFLKSLEMESEVSAFNKFTIPRVAQLTQRSNQFNLRTKRYTEEQVKQIATDENKYSTFAFTLSDKYGQHGLIGIIILEKMKNNILFIDTWIMSCRVLKRGMEQFMLNEIVDYAKKLNCYEIIGEYIETKKNGIVKDHYKNLGFTNLNDAWYLKTDNFKPGTFYIKKK